jgi:ribose-phosphate pyrophosphokinase
MNALLLFALQSSREYGERVAAHLDIPLARCEEREFEDGEHKTRPLENVRGRDVYVVQSLSANTEQSVNDQLIRLLFFIGALKDASADRVTAVMPYLCYARKDRKTKSRDPVTTRYVAALLEAVGTDRVVTMDVHNLAAFQNSFRIPAEHLQAKQLFVERLVGLPGHLVVASPDVGGVKRAEALRQALQARRDDPVSSAFMEKHRSAGVVSGETLVGDVAGRTVILVDDLIASGGTLRRASEACRQDGAQRVIGVATHGAFSAAAAEQLGRSVFDELMVTDTIAATPTWPTELEVLPTAALFARAIDRLHSGGSIVELLGGDPL